MRLLLRGDGCEEAAPRMVRLMCRLLASQGMYRPTGHLYSNKHSTKAHQSAMVATRSELDIILISACEVKRTCCSGWMLQQLAQWSMRAAAGHLYSSERICSEHRFMHGSWRNWLHIPLIALCAGAQELHSECRFAASALASSSCAHSSRMLQCVCPYHVMFGCGVEGRELPMLVQRQAARRGE